MKILKCLSLVLLLGISSCSGGGSSSQDPSIDPSVSPSVEPSVSPSVEPSIEPSQEEPEIDYELTYSSSIITYEGEEYDTHYTYKYKDSYFDTNPVSYSKDLALFSFAFTIEATYKTNVSRFLTTLGFDRLVLSPDYDAPDSKDSVKFAIGHKEIHGTHVIAFASIGRDYKLPWMNNFVIGESGNASGFAPYANRVANTVLEYVRPYEGQNIKFFASGYSRGGGIVSLATHILLKEHSDIANNNNTYCYTFEAPTVVCDEDYMEHPSIFSIYNSGDLISYLPPTKYGFKRLGVAIDLRRDDMDEIAVNFNEKTVLSPFVITKDATNEEEFTAFIVDKFTKVETRYESQGIYDISSRSNYVNHMQQYASYLIGLFFSIKKVTKDDIIDNIADNAFSLLTQDGLYDFLKEKLDAHGETYDDVLLRESCNYLVGFVMYICPDVVMYMLNDDYQSCIIRAAQLHTPEVILPLLLVTNPN